MKQNLYLIYPKRWWLVDPIFKWSEEDINNADEKGFIGSKNGVDCYLTKNLSTISLSTPY